MKKNRFWKQPMKGVETGVCQNNDGGTRILVDSEVCFDWKQDSLFNVIYLLLEKVIGCS